MIELERAEKVVSDVASLIKVEDQIMQRLEGSPSGGAGAIRRRLDTVQNLIERSRELDDVRGRWRRGGRGRRLDKCKNI